MQPGAIHDVPGTGGGLISGWEGRQRRQHLNRRAEVLTGMDLTSWDDRPFLGVNLRCFSHTCDDVPPTYQIHPW